MDWNLKNIWEKNNDRVTVVVGRGLPVFYFFGKDKIIQLGSCPELMKRTIDEVGNIADIFLVPPPRVNILGDNWAGFEFPLWRARFSDFLNPQQIKMIGLEKYVQPVYGRLAMGMFGDYVEDTHGNPQSHWVPKKWVDDVLTTEFKNEIQIEKWKFTFQDDDVIAVNGDFTFSWKDNYNKYCCPEELKTIEGHYFSDQDFGVLVVGNGVGSRNGNTSSFLVKRGDKSIWIDPPAYPLHKAGDLGIAISKVDALVITHVHEDHVEGFAAWWSYLKEQGRVLPLYTSEDVLNQLKRIFNPIVGDISESFAYHPYWELESEEEGWRYRKNFHTIPTLGAKISYKGKCIAISGDTLFNEAFNRGRFQNREINYQELIDLSPQFFRNCQIVFHDTNVTGDPVHTPLQSVELLAQKLPQAKIYSYHLFEEVKSSLVSKSEEGKFYTP